MLFLTFSVLVANPKNYFYTEQYIGEMDSRFWNGLSAGFRRFWKERLSIEMFRGEDYMAVLELRSI